MKKTLTPLAPYIGSKVKLAKTIIEIINRIPHATYAEPFVGMGGIFFRRDKKSKAEIINDFSGDVANLFRIVKRHPKALTDHLLYQLSARSEFSRLKQVAPDTLTDVERAARFLYLQNLAFGGLPTRQIFGTAKERPARFNFVKMQTRIKLAACRLASVVIEQLDFEEFIRRYDSPATLFYLDPPYYGSEDYYGKELFARTDFTHLSTCLKAIQGKFILSINDTQEIRDIFSGFNLHEVDILYSVGKAKVKTGELIINN